MARHRQPPRHDREVLIVVAAHLSILLILAFAFTIGVLCWRQYL